MSNADRRPYLTSTVLDQDFLDACQDNLECRLELIVDIEAPVTDATPDGFIRASDRPKYVDGVFYDNRLKFPLVSRTVGEWLSAEIELSVLKLELNNSDGKFDTLLPGGDDYAGFIGKTVTVKLGLRDVGATFTTIFAGQISDVGGFARTQRSIIVTARDNYEKLQVDFPTTVLTQASFPDIDDGVAGKTAPIIYGDWTTDGNPQTNNASVPAFIVNGQVTIGFPLVRIELFISSNDLTSLDSSGVFLQRGDDFFLIAAADVDTGFFVNVRQFRIIQDSGATLIEGSNFVLTDGDMFWVKVVGKDISPYNDNIVWQARDILITHAGVLAGEFDANWVTFRDKAAPAESSVSTIKSRVWIQDTQSVLQFVLSLLEQVRLEMFIDRDLMLRLNSLAFEDFNAAPVFRVSNFDVEARSLTPQLDTRNNFNRAQAVYNFLPDINENAFSTSVFRNSDAITQQAGLLISKQIVFPNLYVLTDVTNQLKEIIKLASSGYEHVFLTQTWRSLLLDIGDFVFLDVKIGSTVYDSIPCMIREIGYDPEGIKLPVRLWSFQLVPFPGFAGATNSVGGQTASITEET